jgi:hypothetical protein
MKRKVKKNEIQKPEWTRTTSVALTQESLSHDRTEEADASTVICKDCKYASQFESFITVDALHVQCPLCLYVFFMDEAQRKALSGAEFSAVGAGESVPRR